MAEGLSTVATRLAGRQVQRKKLNIKIKHPGRLHRELGVKEGTKIPVEKIKAATHSKNPTVRRDAIRARTMGRWHH